ncbi:acyltransferase [Blastococcus sp. SYSU DS0539]
MRVEQGLLKLGTGSYDLADTRTPGLVNVEGQLVCDGSVAIGQGAQWRIHPSATVRVGEGTYVNTFSIVDVAVGLTIGARCSIAWQVQFIDDDMHSLTIGGEPRPRSAPIVVGDDVWIGSRVTLLKGAHIADGCVVAAGSVVAGRFEEPNCLIGGAPAKVLRKEVAWSQD